MANRPAASATTLHPPDIHAHRILILDFGAQYTQLIARRVRESGVYCEIHPWDMTNDDVRAFGARGVILSGGPESTTESQPPVAPQAVFELGVPVLGICYGMQTMAMQLGGRVTPSTDREFGYAQVTASAPCRLLDGFRDHSDSEGRALFDVWMSHGDRVDALPPGFVAVGFTNNVPLAAMADESRHFYGVQFHPEVTHTLQGLKILERFVREISGCEARWQPGNIIADSIARVREMVGRDKVLLGLSGGVDSSVVGALLHRAIGEQLVCVFVDHGLLRLGEGDQVMETFAKHMGVKVIRVNAEARFLGALKGESDPERKRKIIGRLFVEVFEEESAKLPGHPLAGAGHDLSGRNRIGRLEDRQGARHQESSQRRRPAGEDESEAARAAARAVQGRSAQARRRTRPAARDGLSTSVPGSGTGRAHPRRGDEAIRGPAAQGRRDLSSTSCASTTSTTAPARRSQCSCRCVRSP